MYVIVQVSRFPDMCLINYAATSGALSPSITTSPSTSTSMAAHKQKVIFFDFMGTCCDWLTSLLPALQACPPHSSLTPAESRLRELAIAWREGFFREIHARFKRDEPQEDIDITHRRVLDRILEGNGIGLDVWNDSVRDRLVRQWHMQIPWPDVLPALSRLREDGRWFLVVLANGTARLQLDIAQTSGLPFHTLLSSELLGLTKPDPAMYRKAMDLVQLPPADCTMLASHLYDLAAAKSVGMRTVYVHRDTEDTGLDTIDLGCEHDYVDLYFDGRRKSRDSDQDVGFLVAAKHLIETETQSL
jgi:2-haloalkanoic acid dehalogenase type II